MNKKLLEEKIHDIVNDVFEKYTKQQLTEAFQSSVLKKLFDNNHKNDRQLHHDYLSDIHFNNMWHDVSRITDDMIEGVFNTPQEANVNNHTPYLTFRNGITVVFNDKVKSLNADAEQRFNQRFNSQSTDKFYKENYRSRNQAFNDYRNSYKMWNKDIEQGNKPYFNGDAETRHNSTPSVVKNNYYQKAKDFYKK